MSTRIRGSLFPFALAFLIPGAAVGQHFPPDEELTELVRSRVEEGRGVGIVVGVMEADGSTRIVSYGDAGPNARALGVKSVFEIGSITKVFTASLLADMVTRGEVSLSDPVADLLPDGVTMPSRGGREITLLDLSTQHSGLPRLPDNMSPADATNPYADYTVEQMYALLTDEEYAELLRRMVQARRPGLQRLERRLRPSDDIGDCGAQSAVCGVQDGEAGRAGRLLLNQTRSHELFDQSEGFERNDDENGIKPKPLNRFDYEDPNHDLVAARSLERTGRSFGGAS